MAVCSPAQTQHTRLCDGAADLQSEGVMHRCSRLGIVPAQQVWHIQRILVHFTRAHCCDCLVMEQRAKLL